MNNFFKGTSLESKAKEESAISPANVLNLKTIQELKGKTYPILNIEYDKFLLDNVNVIVDMRAFNDRTKQFVRVFPSYKTFSETLKSIFDETPFWELRSMSNGETLGKRADEFEIELRNGVYYFTLTPDLPIPQIFAGVKLSNGTASERVYFNGVINLLRQQKMKKKGKIRL